MKLTILLSVYNGGEFLERAVESVLQEPEKFELLIINDGSTDDTKKTATKLAAKDDRIRVINQENQGLTAALNRGIEEAKGKYIARMDDDDFTMPGRLKKQLAVLDANEEIVLVAGGFRIVAFNEEFKDHIYPYLKGEDLSRKFYLGNAIAHGSVMYRKDAAIAAGKYRSEVGPTEDYDLWTRMTKQGKVVAIPQLVYSHRMNPGGVSVTNNEKQQRHMRENLDKLWAEGRPPVFGPMHLRRNRAFYNDQPYGRDQWIWHYYRDNAQLGVKMIRYGYRFAGVMQLLSVALTGKAGLRAVYERIQAVNPRKI